MKKSSILLVFVLLLLVAAGCATNPDEGSRIAPEIGAIAPPFTLENTSGQQVSLVDHRGKVVLINFWATWCPPCRQEMPGILSRYEQYQPDLVVLSIDAGDSVDSVLDFMDEFGFTFNPLLDSNQDIQDLYRITGLPTSLFVDANGVIRFVHIGYMAEDQLDKYLAQMGLSETSE